MSKSMFPIAKARILALYSRSNGAPLTRAGAKFAEWHTPPPPDPIFLRRLRQTRWEIGAYFVFVTTLISFLAWSGTLINFLSTVITFLIPGYIAVRTRRAVPAVGHLMDLPFNGEQFPVVLSYSCGAIRFGSDTGIVDFDGQRMNFEGLESRFSIRRSDVLMADPHRRCRRKRRVQNFRLRLGYAVDGVPFFVEIQPIDGVDGVGKGFRPLFRAAASEWQANSDEASGEPVFPPLGVTERSLNRAARDARLGLAAATVGVPATVYALIRFMQSHSPHPAIGLPVVLSWTLLIWVCLVGFLWGRSGILSWLQANQRARLSMLHLEPPHENKIAIQEVETVNQLV